MSQLEFTLPAPSAKTVTRDCVNCGATFTRLRKHVDRPRHPGIYCSRSCGVIHTNKARKGRIKFPPRYGEDNPNWKGGVSKDHYRYKLRFAEKNPEKVRAHKIVADAKKRGTLVPEPCIECGTTERVHAHHHDYSKPLEVEWICQPCHNRHHHLGRRSA